MSNQLATLDAVHDATMVMCSMRHHAVKGSHLSFAGQHF